MGIVLPADDNWPKKLNDLGKKAPKQLWYEGEWEAKLFEKCACVVGSRRMTEYGRRVIEKLVPKLVDSGWTIVSGMMYGMDQAAHKMCLECGGKTIGVLGWGIKYKSLSDEDIKLIKQVIDGGGLVISEWEEQAGTLWTFPMRDRIMAALATDIYVVEAAVKSGALITADWGIKLHRQIWAVPGPITSRVSEGTNWLVAQGLAKIWVPSAKASEDQDPRYINHTEVCILLQNEALTVDDIARKTGRTVADLGAELTMMILKEEVEEKEGKYYLLSGQA